MCSSYTKLTTQLIHKVSGKKTACLLLGLSAVFGAGCSTLDYKRMVYDALRQHDCRTNDQAGEFCSRTFALDYYDYKALRSDYLTAMSAASNTVSSSAVEIYAIETYSTESIATELNVN